METPRTKRMRHCSNSNRNLMDLDNDNLVNIFSRLPVESVCSVGCVSKALHNIVSRPSFLNQHMSSLVTTNAAAEVPQLVIVSQSKKKYMAELIAMQSFEYDGNTLEMRRDKTRIVSKIMSWWYEYFFNVHFVFCNLICLKDRHNGSRCVLLNPLKGEAVMLPTCIVQVPEHLKTTVFSYYWFGMGFDNTTSTHKVVRVCADSEYNYYVAHVYVLGTRLWREICSVPPCDLTVKNLSAYGDMHWLIRRATTGRAQANIRHCMSILSFDFKKEEFGWNIPDPPLRNMPRKFHSVQRFHLINLRGSLSVVDASSDKHLDIWMLKNYDEKEWVLGHRIEARMINAECRYRSYRLWTCCEWEHGIFFKRSRKSNSTVVLLDLRTVCIHRVKCPIYQKGLYTSIFSYTSSLISLKCYGNLIPLKRYGKPIEAEESRRSGSFMNIWHLCN
ncbi:F-box/kelch-repeat protein At3g06240-like [Pyrus communis]|uniref:F-box/kelch-repeat protein At3g06240-like n=1 Tax=Pyrus communis TaxID=23211 RepID=UPI0035BF6FB6